MGLDEDCLQLIMSGHMQYVRKAKKLVQQGELSEGDLEAAIMIGDLVEREEFLNLTRNGYSGYVATAEKLIEKNKTTNANPPTLADILKTINLENSLFVGKLIRYFNDLEEIREGNFSNLYAVREIAKKEGYPSRDIGESVLTGKLLKYFRDLKEVENGSYGDFNYLIKFAEINGFPKDMIYLALFAAFEKDNNINKT